MQLLFVRHGQTDNNAQKLIQGRNNPPLNEKGLSQAREIAEKLVDMDFSSIVSSPLLRAKQTAEIIAQRKGLLVEFDERLMERDFGLLQDQPYDRLNRLGETDLPDFFFDGYQEFQVEPICDMIARVTEFLRDLSQRRTGNILVVAHGGIGYFFDQILSETTQPRVADNGQVQIYNLDTKKE